MTFSASFLRSCSLFLSRQIPTDSSSLLFSTTHGFAARVAAVSTTSKTGKSKTTTTTAGAKKKQATASVKVKAAVKQPVKPKRPLSAWNFYMKEHLTGKVPEGVTTQQNLTTIAANYKRLKPAELEKYQMEAAQDLDRHASEKPLKVKRPLTSYNFFVKEHMPNRPKDKKVTEYMSVLATEFKNLSVNDRVKYDKASATDYDRAKTAKDSLPKKDEQPRKPLNSYNIFVQEHMLNRPEGLLPKEMMKQLGQDWRGLNANQKKKYEDLAAREKNASGNNDSKAGSQ